MKKQRNKNKNTVKIPRYFVFEGIDGSGKDTQMLHFINYLKNKNKYQNILITREPTDNTKEWRKIIERLQNGFKNKEEEIFLYIKDRIKTHKNYKKLLEVNKDLFIVSSRSELSTYSYQTEGDINYDTISLFAEKLDKNKDILHADITFVFTVSPEKTLKRIKERAKKTWEKLDIFEEEKFLEVAQEKYIAATFFLSEKYNMNFIFVDSNGTIEEVTQRMIKGYEEFLVSSTLEEVKEEEKMERVKKIKKVKKTKKAKKKAK